MNQSDKKSRIFVIIPAFNEESVIGDVLAEVKGAGYENIIVVDDGSRDNTYGKAAAVANVTAIKHFINRGKGASVKTGMEAAKLLGADMAITMDGDGQHNPEDIRKMIALIEEGHDVILGTRLKNPKGMPFYKIIANHIGNFLTWSIYGLWVTDSQSGFRAYSQKALNLIETKTDRYEYDSEVIREISRHQLKYAETPIEVRYTEYSMNKPHKMDLKNGVKALFKMIIS